MLIQLKVHAVPLPAAINAAQPLLSLGRSRTNFYIVHIATALWSKKIYSCRNFCNKYQSKSNSAAI
jgi:hypothetical protein